jgi:hypothetical protein
VTLYEKEIFCNVRRVSNQLKIPFAECQTTQWQQRQICILLGAV